MSLYTQTLTVYRISRIDISCLPKVPLAGKHTHKQCLCWLRLNESSCCRLALIDNFLCQADAPDTLLWVSKGLNKCSPFSMWHRECRRWWCTAIQVTGILLFYSHSGLISCHLTYQGAVVTLLVTWCFLGNDQPGWVQTGGEEIVLPCKTWLKTH